MSTEKGWRLQDEHEGQECGIQACLMVANNFRKSGKLREAEHFYKRALQQADGLSDDGSPLVGMVLLDLVDFYEEQGRLDEAEPARERVRKILIDSVNKFLNG